MPDPAPPDPAAACSDLDRILAAEGPAAMVDRLVALVEQQGTPRDLLDALLLAARLELGLPAIPGGPMADLTEATRTQYEDRYLAAIRRVGHRLIAAGDLAAAWPYFRAIAEREPIAEALEACNPAPNEEQVGLLIEIAFHQGAHPRKGFEWLLDHYGTCSAISSFEHLPPDEAVRADCADRLVRRLHEQLVASLRSDIERRGQPPLPPVGATIRELVADRPWLFEDENYHIDLSHLAATVRLSPLLTDPASIALAEDLTEYGRRLSPRHQYDGEPPFEHVYPDHGHYLRALLGRDVDRSIEHFAARLVSPDSDDPDPYRSSLPAQVLVRLLDRTGRLDRAIDIAAEHLTDVPESQLTCPSLPTLCRKAGRLDRLAEIARRRGDLVHFAAALLDPVATRST